MGNKTIVIQPEALPSPAPAAIAEEGDARDLALEEAAKACEAWGNAKVAKWQDDPEMGEDAKARAWDAVQCAVAIRALKGKPEAAKGCDHAD